MDDLVLFAVASNGSVEQWDGLATPTGILLRWFAASGLGFPDYGYDVYRATVPDARPLVFDNIHAAAIEGQPEYDYNTDVILASAQLLHMQQIGFDRHALVVSSGATVEIRFPAHAWYLLLQSDSSGSAIEVKAYNTGTLKEVRTLPAGSSSEWVTRGIDRIELTGVGRISFLSYRLLESQPSWTHLTHLCLPVTDLAYACGPAFAGTDEDEAKKRVPAAVQANWGSRYQPVFTDLHPTLKALATHTPPPALPQPIGTNTPKLTLDPEAAIRLSTLDPHVARIVGLAWDDSVPLNGTFYTYKVVGRWQGSSHEIEVAGIPLRARPSESGVALKLKRATATETRDGLLLQLGTNGSAQIEFAEPADQITLELRPKAKLSWRALDSAAVEVGTGALRREERGLSIGTAGIKYLELSGTADVILGTLRWTGAPIERFALLPGIAARDLGPPSGPTWITAVPEQPGGTAGPLQAILDWDVDVSSAGAYAEGASVFYQIGGLQLSTDIAAAQPAVPPFDRRNLLRRGALITVPPSKAVLSPPRRLMADRGDQGSGLVEQWRAWWARGVDLFGRASAPSPPVVKKLEDSAKPPPPVLLSGEYAQGDLPALNAVLSGQSAFARAWLAANPGKNAVIAVWAWTPELEAQCPDVDGFRLYLRRPTSTGASGGNAPAVSYDQVSWGTSQGDLGPIPVRFDGTVSTITDGLATPVAITAIQPLGSTRSRYTTNLTFDVGAGALIGATLGAANRTIAGNGEGAGLSITVDHPANAAPASGNYTIGRGTSDVITIQTTLAPPAVTNQFRRRFSGTLVIGSNRLLVLSASGGTFVCRARPAGGGTPPVINVGDAVSWYPAHAIAVQDTGFGPQASATTPIANAQVTATSVRRWSGRQVESGPSVPATITAVDAKPPQPPVVDPILAGDYCAELATRADWYGVSRFTLKWATDPNVRYVVYRALWDSVWRLDLVEHTQPSVKTHAYPTDAWPSGVWSDSQRKPVVEGDLQTLDTDLAAALALPSNDPQRASKIESAYGKLHADTQQLIAGQPYARSAYVLLTGTPLEPGEVPFIDELDGRSRAHWFYRVASRSQAGLESALSPPTPPICCPDVVPPEAPRVQVALADENGGKVKLRWLASPERALAHYRVYRAPDEVAAADIRSMQEVAVVAPSPSSAPAAGLTLPSAVTGKSNWLEYAAPAPPGEWFFRITAEDKAGNRSEPSRVLRGKSLKLPPAPPVWVSASRTPATNPTAVALAWSHPSDLRLTCLVERRTPGEDLWVTIAPWLPRSVYTFTDTPPELTASWEYRLRIRDNLGQMAATFPTTLLPAQP